MSATETFQKRRPVSRRGLSSRPNLGHQRGWIANEDRPGNNFKKWLGHPAAAL
jgi:hypothetical protein